jgi:heme oxygenase
MNEELEKLKEYKRAYEYLLEYWESLDKEQHKQINKDLNKIFILNTGEQVEDEEEDE